MAHNSKPVTLNLLVNSSKKSAFLNNTSATTDQYVQPDEKDLTIRKILASRYPESMLIELEDKFVAFFEKN